MALDPNEEHEIKSKQDDRFRSSCHQMLSHTESICYVSVSVCFASA